MALGVQLLANEGRPTVVEVFLSRNLAAEAGAVGGWRGVAEASRDAVAEELDLQSPDIHDGIGVHGHRQRAEETPEDYMVRRGVAHIKLRFSVLPDHHLMCLGNGMRVKQGDNHVTRALPRRGIESGRQLRVDMDIESVRTVSLGARGGLGHDRGEPCGTFEPGADVDALEVEGDASASFAVGPGEDGVPADDLESVGEAAPMTRADEG
mmetsp:Transcript_38383/g.110768  ORF Transcript_38383/g.110768 Transcript_38383/m.110768 type:complete len:209 (-) Transcript_38383:22-648(-)